MVPDYTIQITKLEKPIRIPNDTLITCSIDVYHLDENFPRIHFWCDNLGKVKDYAEGVRKSLQIVPTISVAITYINWTSFQ